MKRYWFTFEYEADELVISVLGYGVTAYDYRDALNLLKENIFLTNPIPKVKGIIEDIDVSTLDAGHILPNMTSPSIRGVWYPGMISQC